MRLVAFWRLADLLSVPAWGQGMTQGIMSPPANVRPPGLKNVGIEQRLNEQVPLDLTFRDETGKTVQFGRLLRARSR